MDVRQRLNRAAFRRFRGRKRSNAEAVLEVVARLDYGPRAVLKIGLHLLRGRIWGLFRRDIADLLSRPFPPALLDAMPLAAITALCVGGSDLRWGPRTKARGIRTHAGQIFWNHLAEIEKMCY